MTETNHYRHTKIIFTIGPATDSEERLTAMISAGVDICRLNMAHGSEEWTRETIRKVRQTCANIGREIAIMMDVKGPEIRTGIVPQPIELAKGDILELWTVPPYLPNKAHQVTVNYRDLPKDVSPGNVLLVDSGLIRLEVLETGDDWVRTVVVIPGKLGNKRHINLPGVEINLPSLTEKDERDIQIAVEEGIDFIALSFVRTAAAVSELRSRLTALDSHARIIAKIEDQCGLANITSIVQSADAIMVARGDLGIEIPYEQLPIVQRQAVNACLTEGKPVIIATHLLESMIQSPMPTRAEITDVANAVREQADCVMLSGETTTGLYPLECVDVMKRIIGSCEGVNTRELNRLIKLKTPKAKMLRSAAVLAQELGDSGVLLFTRSGFLAQMIAALRPTGVPIYAFTDIPHIFRHMLILWGVEPFLMKFSDDPEETIANAFEYLCRQNWCKKGQYLAVITNALGSGGKIIDTMQLRKVE